jgi:Signal transduction histidine kinase
MHDQRHSEDEHIVEAWYALKQVRWPLVGVVALAFALMQGIDALLLYGTGWSMQLVINILVWSCMGGMSAWALLTWVIKQNRRYHAIQTAALREQQRLNSALQRSNGNLALLNEVNRRIASSATIDQILDYAIALPHRLIQARAAVIAASSNWASLNKRLVGNSIWNDDALLLRWSVPDNLSLERLRSKFELDRVSLPPSQMQLLQASQQAHDEEDTEIVTCLVVPVNDGDQALGWMECFLSRGQTPDDDQRELLQTIGGEIGEAIGAARRRAQELEDRYALDRAVDEERARIARDMHDGIAQNLAFLRMRADLWSDWLNSEPERLPNEFAAFKTTLREQIEELRRAIFALRPLDLHELGFDAALRRFIYDFAAQQGWQASLTLGEALPTLTPALELACFRLIQEALNNVAKHAHAQQVRVVLRSEGQGLSISISDDGIGFDPSSVEASDRLGLRQMRERIATLGGRLSLLSRVGKGTEIRAWVPV